MTAERDWVRELAPGQVYFDYGPVSMVVTAVRNGTGDSALCAPAAEVVERNLRTLGQSLDMLRRYPAHVDPEALTGTARQMADAVLATGDPWLTPMAAVVGAMSDAVADFLWEQGAEKVTANNGGDIALRLAPGQKLDMGILYDLNRSGVDRVVRLLPEHGIGGVATSGLGGRSLTTGIASSVTAFSARCARADALATLLADRSYIDSPAVHTCLAAELDPDSDIADLTVVTAVDPLTEAEKRKALDQVLTEAELQYRRGGLRACVAAVQGMTATFDPEKILNDR